MGIIKTDRTYGSAANAVKALDRACERLGVTRDSLRWMVAVAEDGRFAPVVLYGGETSNLRFAHVGVTVVS